MHMPILESIGFTFRNLSELKPSDPDTFINFCSMLKRAQLRELTKDPGALEELLTLVQETGTKVKQVGHEEYLPTVEHITREKIAVLAKQRHVTVVKPRPRYLRVV